MLDQLLDDHRRILAAAAELELQLTPVVSSDVSGVARLRWALIRDILRHFSAEDGFVDFARARTAKAQSPGSRTPGEKLSPTCFARMLRGHVAQWSMESPAGAWTEFRESVLALLAALRAQIAFEETEIYPELRMAVAPKNPTRAPPDRARPGAMRGRY